MKEFRPMLACSDVPDLSKVQYPVLASPKLDGIRCVVRGGKALTRALKLIPNKFIREWLSQDAFEGLDGELILPGATFQATTSAVMSHEGTPSSIEWHVFDDSTDGSLPFVERFARAQERVQLLCELNEPNVKIVDHFIMENEAMIVTYEAEQLKAGFEGVMLRSLDGPYKFGRSTMREGWLLKLKRFEDAEAEIIGFEQLMTNTNEQTRNERGYAKRSSAKAGLVPVEALGAFVLQRIGEKQSCTKCGDWVDGDTYKCTECLGTGMLTFRCGSGMDDAQKKNFWLMRDELLGMLVKYKHQPHGAKDAPRSPVFLGIRDRSDL